MTAKSDFTEEDWIRVRRAPLVAGMAISIADPGGPIEATKELMATIKSATNPPSDEQLLTEIALDLQSMTQQKQNPLRGFNLIKDAKPGEDVKPGQEVLDELRAVKAIVASKATPQETDAFSQWLVVTAQAAAEAAKEGGFLGFGARQVSQGEKDMLDQLHTALGME